jgi:lysophospholipase L1-like esterase
LVPTIEILWVNVMDQRARSDRFGRREFLGYAAGGVATAVLSACSRSNTLSGVSTPVPSIAYPLNAPSQASARNLPDATRSRASPASAMDAPRTQGNPLTSAGLVQGIEESTAQRAFISPLDHSWLYSYGPWSRLSHPGWPTDRMAAVMSDAWASDGRVVKAGVGRRCAIITSSPFATLLAENDGRTFSLSLDGGPPARVGPLPRDGSRVEVPLFAGHSGTTRIELIFDESGTNDGMFVAAGATIAPVVGRGTDERRLVVFGNGYAAGTGASAPGTTGCAALIGERLGIEAISQGWAHTDVDVRSGEPGVPPNSGLDRTATDVIALKPDAILLIYGLHAAGAPRASWEYSYHFAQMLRTIRSALTSVPILCSGFPPCNEDVSAAFVQEWNGAVRGAANTVDNCPFIEAAAWWGPANYAGGGGPVYVGGDRVHPNDAGHRFLADKYAAAIAPYMG